MDHDPQYTLAQIERLRAERDALERRLREVKSQLTSTINRHRERVVMNNWAEARLARHGIPMPETPRCRYPDCVGGKQGTICHDSCPGGNPSFG